MENKKSNLWEDFKIFIAQGNIIELATAVIIGTSFGKIVASFVNDILMPPIGFLLGAIDFKYLKYTMKEGVEAVTKEGKIITEAVPSVSLNYGLFIQNIIDFTIIAFCIFIFIRIAQGFQKKKEEEPKPEVVDKQEVLLAEIRDLLKNRPL